MYITMFSIIIEAVYWTLAVRVINFTVADVTTRVHEYTVIRMLTQVLSM